MPTIPCRCCGGTGRVELTGVYAQTLELLATQAGREVSGADLARLAAGGTTGEAMNNRLVALERLGLAAARKFGRKRLWRAVSRAAQPE